MQGLLRSGNRYERHLAVWISIFARESSDLVDAIYSNMALLGAAVNPSELPSTHTYVAALIRLSQTFLKRGGKAVWLLFLRMIGDFGPYTARKDREYPHLDDRICTFISQEWQIRRHSALVSNTGKETRMSTAGMKTYHLKGLTLGLGTLEKAPTGWMDDLGYLHLRLPTWFFAAGTALPPKWDSPDLGTSSVFPFDVWIADLGGEELLLILAKHAQNRWHIYGSQYRLYQKWGLKDRKPKKMDLVIGGPNPVHDLFTAGKSPWQEKNITKFKNGFPCPPEAWRDRLQQKYRHTLKKLIRQEKPPSVIEKKPEGPLLRGGRDGKWRTKEKGMPFSSTSGRAKKARPVLYG